MKMLLGIALTVIGLGVTAFGIMNIISAQKSPEPDKEIQENATSVPQKDAIQDENYEKGRKFEEFTVGLFDKKYFDILDWRGDKVAEDGRFAKANQLPDLEMQLNLRDGSHRFAIECKWRSRLDTTGGKWTYPAQLERYRTFAEERGVPVFIVLGVGGKPEAPKYVNVIPLEAIKDEVFTPAKLAPYLRKEANAPFFYDADTQTLR